MRKLVGFALLQLAALLCAAMRIQSGKRRAEALRSFCAMLEQLYGLLETEASPMPELIQALSGRCEGAAGDFIKSLYATLDDLGKAHFEALWLSALETQRGTMDECAYRELAALGSVLGRYGLEIQLGALSRCAQALRAYRDKLNGELPGAGRLTLGLSLSASLLMGILLL